MARLSISPKILVCLLAALPTGAAAQQRRPPRPPVWAPATLAPGRLLYNATHWRNRHTPEQWLIRRQAIAAAAAAPAHEWTAGGT